LTIPHWILNPMYDRCRYPRRLVCRCLIEDDPMRNRIIAAARSLQAQHYSLESRVARFAFE
jgi:hypothetical protein